jgi:hypothetical protein
MTSRPGRHADRVSSLRATRIASRRNQLIQDLGGRLRAHVTQLAQGGNESSAERGRHGKAGQPTLECLHSAPV